MAKIKIKTILLSLLIILPLLVKIPETNTAATKSFYFKDSMSKEVLRNYASRAVTSWLVLENNTPSPIFEEDLRMHLRIGAKYLGRAATFSWGGNMTKAQVDKHFADAKEIAKKVHAADPEIILQGGVFEIIYEGTVNGTEIPAFVFEAFNQPVVKRNFKYTDMVFPEGHRYAPGFWGTGPGGAVPKIANLETQMYFYYNICRYIDAGFEAIHIGQSEMMMDYTNTTNAVDWDRVLTLARAYAENNARRGIVLIDAHSALDSGGIKVGNRLLLDIQAAALVPNETQKKDGAMMCEIKHFHTNPLSWVGRSDGGLHPLGFNVTQNITILEFDNYGSNPNGQLGIPTFNAFYVWGYDDITWFALQPEWYRNQFLLETDQYLKTEPKILDENGQQIYFLQPTLKRVITANQSMTYVPGPNYNPDFVVDYLSEERTVFKFNENPLSFDLTIRKDYRANRHGDACPNGSNQEDTIREIFLGKNAAENPKYLEVIFPDEYKTGDISGTVTVTPSPTPSPTSSPTTAPTAKPDQSEDRDQESKASEPASDSNNTSSSQADLSESLTSEIESDDLSSGTSDLVSSDSSLSEKNGDSDGKPKSKLIVWILAGSLVLAGLIALLAIYLLKRKKGKP